MRKTALSRSRTPWWLDADEEICACCRHGYAYEAEYRCVACDRGVCHHCVVLTRETATALCAECYGERRDLAPTPRPAVEPRGG